jgi:acyl-CoA reductase-like NAD-dependent aldehyde dehydrogenase
MTTRNSLPAAGLSTAHLNVISPSTGQVIGSVEDMTVDQVKAIATRLRANQPAWHELGFEGRRQWVHRFRDWILDHEREIQRVPAGVAV